MYSPMPSCIYDIPSGNACVAVLTWSRQAYVGRNVDKGHDQEPTLTGGTIMEECGFEARSITPTDVVILLLVLREKLLPTGNR